LSAGRGVFVTIYGGPGCHAVQDMHIFLRLPPLRHPQPHFFSFFLPILPTYPAPFPPSSLLSPYLLHPPNSLPAHSQSLTACSPPPKTRPTRQSQSPLLVIFSHQLNLLNTLLVHNHHAKPLPACTVGTLNQHIYRFFRQVEAIRNRKGRGDIKAGEGSFVEKKGSSAKKKIQKKNLNSDSNSKPPIPNTPKHPNNYQKDKLKLLIAGT